MNINTNHLDFLIKGRDNLGNFLGLTFDQIKKRITKEILVEYNGNKYKIINNVSNSKITDKTINIFDK